MTFRDVSAASNKKSLRLPPARSSFSSHSFSVCWFAFLSKERNRQTNKQEKDRMRCRCILFRTAGAGGGGPSNASLDSCPLSFVFLCQAHAYTKACMLKLTHVCLHVCMCARERLRNVAETYLPSFIATIKKENIAHVSEKKQWREKKKTAAAERLWIHASHHKKQN
jgi:hypothetical protein